MATRFYTDAPVCYDYTSWCTEIDPCVAITRRKREPVRLVEISDTWHAEQQAMRYGSGLHFTFDEGRFQEELANEKYGIVIPVTKEG